MNMPKRQLGVLAAILLSSACSSPIHQVAFESVDYETVDCVDAVVAGSDCLQVTAPVVGTGVGQGRCVVYATGGGRNLWMAADSGELTITAGETEEWLVEVRERRHPEFEGWNPICLPAVEG